MEPRGRLEGSLGLGRAGAGARPRERGRESETSRTRSATEVGDEPLRATRRGTEGRAQPHPRQRDELHRQLPKLLRARHEPRENQTTRNGCERARTRPSEETKLRLRAMDWFSERAQNGHSVPVESPIGDPNDRGVGNVLSEEGGKVWAVVGQFSLEPGLRAVRASLLCVRRADRDVRGGVRIAKGVGGLEVCAWDEARKLGLSCVVTGLSSGVNECGDRVVAAGGLAQVATGGVGVQRAGLASSTGFSVAGPRRTSSASGPKPFPPRPQHSHIQQ